jgi:S-methylmethionine-dependent homocysteine/selenocysteine methylase
VPTTARATVRPRLPQLDAPVFVTDGGLETSLIHLQGVELADFAAFPLLGDPDGRRALDAYYTPYLDLAGRHGVGIVLDTPTWRANPDWGARLGFDQPALAAVNAAGVTYVRALADSRRGLSAVVNGVVGPRGDGYEVGETMTPAEARAYHLPQVRAFAQADADMVTAVTMTYIEEAVGVAQAAIDVGLPVAIGFTVETDGCLPSGPSLREAVEEVDAATLGGVAYYMVNCAHPSHFEGALESPGTAWLGRIKAIRANASTLSHAELDELDGLDRGDPLDLAAHYDRLRELLPDLRVVGGCCGTDHEHVELLAARARVR